MVEYSYCEVATFHFFCANEELGKYTEEEHVSVSTHFHCLIDQGKSLTIQVQMCICVIMITK